jgi:predicted DNA-binding protein with PD1-like motif
MMDKTYWYKEYTQGRRFFLKILPGQSVQENIKALVVKEKIKVGVILSAIGSVRKLRINGIKSGAKLPINPGAADSA